MAFVRFNQLGGEKKTLELAGWAAPAGRPYKEAILRDAIEPRQGKVYYPGGDEAPTRHVFGVRYEAIELKGRLRDKDLGGPGGSAAKIEEIKAFVRDCQRVRFTWDNLVSVVGFITKFDPGRESRGEADYKLTFDVDSDDYADRKPKKVQRRAPDDFTSQILAQLKVPAELRDLGGLTGSVLDIADTLTNTMQVAVGAVQSAADGVADFSKATLGQLSRIASVTSGIRTACATFTEAITSLPSGVALIRERADDNMRLWKAQTTAEDAIRKMMSESADANRAARIAATGKTKTTYSIQAGDTWASISNAFYGSADRAVDLQVANGLTGGPPKPGTTIRIPF